MESIGISFNPLMVAGSIFVAIMAAFTGLRLTQGLNQLAPLARRPRIAQAAFAIGGGIWAMHFVGMLAITTDALITYAALPTLLSLLIAILVVGAALILLHFGERTRAKIIAAGALASLGIVCMHFVGMSAVGGGCVASTSYSGIAIASLVSTFACVLAFHLAYQRRTLALTIAGAIGLGLAIAAMHYSAIAFTDFNRLDTEAPIGAPILSTGSLALLVAIAAFFICGFFLLHALPIAADPAGLADVLGGAPPAPRANLALSKVGKAAGQIEGAAPVRLPFEQDQNIRFIAPDQIAAIRADGHYARLTRSGVELFCPWSLSKIEKALAGSRFARTHRSYLVNLDQVDGFRREGDKGVCLLVDGQGEIPVSRGKLGEVQRALGLLSAD